MKQLKFKPSFLALIFLTLTLFTNRVYSQSKLDCYNVNTQAEINACARSKYIAADKELNLIYKKVLNKLDAPQKFVLIQSQRKWLSFRDEYCKIYGLLYAGGSMAASTVIKCKTETTLARIAELRALYEELDV